MAALFGTDGVRAVAGSELTPELALALARASAQVLGGRRVAVGRDTRPSGSMLAAAAAGGFASAGLDVIDLGMVPTPLVAHAVATGEADLGLVVSASHNPMPDNGLKLFGAGGWKLTEQTEAEIEAALEVAGPRATGTAVGRISRAEEGLAEGYLHRLLDAVPAGAAGLRVVVDCAQGAGSRLAPLLYRMAGAEVEAIFADGDGSRINDGCGATDLARLRREVVARGADAGIAHDGDADRCLMVDAAGQVVDGDQLLAVLAIAAGARSVVTTVMSNLGFSHAMAAAGIGVVRTAVGDRHVLDAMRAGGHLLGGEQSGHTIQLAHSTTGDGLLTALSVLGRMVSTGSSLAELAGVVTVLPQVLVNVAADGDRAGAPDVQAAVCEAEQQLDGDGRVLLRPSGTEPVVRVMVEAPTEQRAREVADRLAAVVGGAAVG